MLRNLSDDQVTFALGQQAGSRAGRPARAAVTGIGCAPACGSTPGTHAPGRVLSLLGGGQDVAEAAALVEAFRDELAAQIHAAVSPSPGLDDGPGTLTLLAVRGYLGYVDAVIVHSARAARGPAGPGQRGH